MDLQVRAAPSFFCCATRSFFLSFRSVGRSPSLSFSLWIRVRMMKGEEEEAEEQNCRHHCTREHFLSFFSQIIRFFLSAASYRTRRKNDLRAVTDDCSKAILDDAMSEASLSVAAAAAAATTTASSSSIEVSLIELILSDERERCCGSFT